MVKRLTPVYKAVAKVKLERSQVSGTLFDMFQMYENPIATESRVIESRMIAEEVTRRLDPSSVSLDPAAFQGLVDSIQGSIRAEALRETNIIQIFCIGTDPARVTNVANLTAEVYIEANLNEKNKQAHKVREFVESQLAEADQRLKVVEDKLEQMRQEGSATGVAVALEKRIAELQNTVTNLLGKMTEAHPDVIRAREQLDQLKAQLPTLPHTELEYARLSREAEVTEKTYRTLREKLEEVRIAEAEKSASASLIERALAPKAPQGIAQRRELAIVVGMLLGIVLGCVLAFVLETMDTSLGTIEDVETLLQVPVLGVIPHLGSIEEAEQKSRWRLWPTSRKRKVEHEEKMDLAVYYYPTSIAAEAYRILRTNVKFSPERKVILITSSGPGEGKSTVVTNLGLVTAQGGARTVLISGDLRKPQLSKSFGLQREAGLTEILRGDLTIERGIRGLSDFILGKFGYDEAVKHPYLANLFVVPSGRIPENPVEVVGSKAMEGLLNTLKAQFDVVLVDAPPLLPVADSLLLAPHVDGVVMVYEVGRISRAALLRAKVQLESVSVKLLGVVLNHVRPELQTQPGYYYYRERYAYAPEKESSPTRSST